MPKSCHAAVIPESCCCKGGVWWGDTSSVPVGRPHGGTDAPCPVPAGPQHVQGPGPRGRHGRAAGLRAQPAAERRALPVSQRAQPALGRTCRHQPGVSKGSGATALRSESPRARAFGEGPASSAPAPHAPGRPVFRHHHGHHGPRSHNQGTAADVSTSGTEAAGMLSLSTVV